MNWQAVLAVIAAGALVFWLYMTIKKQPSAFTQKNISQSFLTMGVLAIALIVFIALCVWVLKMNR